MSYRTVLLHQNHFEELPDNARISAQLARKFNAHLIGLVTENLPLMMGPGVSIQVRMDDLEGHASRFEQFCEEHGVDSYEAQVILKDPFKTIIEHARCSDLLVFSQPHLRSTIKHDRLLVESVLLDAGKPCLFIPHAGEFDHVGRSIMLAWDGSREAARATSDAMPLLCASDSVEVVIINGKSGKNKEPDNIVFTGIEKYLVRHNVNVKVKEIVSSIDVGNTLLSHAADSGADLCVMGAYGHSRIQEWIWGGATRTILETMTLPVFMSH